MAAQTEPLLINTHWVTLVQLNCIDVVYNILQKQALHSQRILHQQVVAQVQSLQATAVLQYDLVGDLREVLVGQGQPGDAGGLRGDRLIHDRPGTGRRSQSICCAEQQQQQQRG